MSKDKLVTKKQQKWQAKTLDEMFATIKRGQEYVTVVMQRGTWEELQYAINLAFREEEKYMAKKKLTVKVPAIKEKSGKIVKAPSKAWSHEELIVKEGKKAKGSKHEFELSDGEVVNRKKAAKVAETAGEVPKSVGKKLHSHDLRKAERIKKLKEKDIK